MKGAERPMQIIHGSGVGSGIMFTPDLTHTISVPSLAIPKKIHVTSASMSNLQSVEVQDHENAMIQGKDLITPASATATSVKSDKDGASGQNTATSTVSNNFKTAVCALFLV